MMSWSGQGQCWWVCGRAGQRSFRISSAGLLLFHIPYSKCCAHTVEGCGRCVQKIAISITRCAVGRLSAGRQSSCCLQYRQDLLGQPAAERKLSAMPHLEQLTYLSNIRKLFDISAGQ
jgi:hypothetical protein